MSTCNGLGTVIDTEGTEENSINHQLEKLKDLQLDRALQTWHCISQHPRPTGSASLGKALVFYPFKVHVALLMWMQLRMNDQQKNIVVNFYSSIYQQNFTSVSYL